MIGQKTSFSKFKKTEIIPAVFSNHNGLKLEINNKRKAGKSTNKWKLPSEQAVDQRRNQKRNSKNIETNGNGNTTHKNLWNATKAILKF